jgi:hypothetical protein
MSLRWPVALIAMLVVALFGAHAGGLLRLAYPLLAVALGIYLEGTKPSRYVAFVVWLWAVSPLVRRLADVQAGFQDPSFIILTPYLVSAVGVGQRFVRAYVLRTRPLPKTPAIMVFLFAIAGAAVGLPIGVLTAPSRAALETLNWVLPPMFGWYLAAMPREDRRDIEAALCTTLLDVALVAGAYGVWQFLSPQPWDAEWMLNSGMYSIGFPEPFQVRVFSTMHAPGVLATVLVVPLTLWLAAPTAWRMPAACLGTAALLMSQVRAAWLAFAVAAVFVMVSLPGRLRLRLAVLVPLACLSLAPLLTSPDVSEVTVQRMVTITAPGQDQSALSRLAGHFAAFSYVTDHPLGGGIGFSDPELEYYIGMRDSVVVAALVQFGAIGAAIYGIGFVCLVALMWGYYRRAEDTNQIGLAAAALALLATAALGAVTAGPAGMVLWTIAGLAAGSREPSTSTDPLTRYSAECVA